jgi:hypothetical protein
VKNWKELIGNRKEWNNLVENTKTHPRVVVLQKRKKKKIIYSHADFHM